MKSMGAGRQRSRNEAGGGQRLSRPSTMNEHYHRWDTDVWFHGENR